MSCDDGIAPAVRFLPGRDEHMSEPEPALSDDGG